MAKKINKKFGPSLYNTKVKDPYGKSVVNKPSNSKKKPYGMASKTSDEKKVVKKVETKKNKTLVESINDWADRTFRNSANRYAEKINKTLDKNFRDPVNKYADKKLREPANKIADKINKVLDKNFRDPINNAIRGKKTETKKVVTKKPEVKKVKSKIESLKKPEIRKKVTIPEVVVTNPKKSEPTVSQLWKEKTGTSWSEAKKQGLTDGSASSNIALMKKLKSGEISKSSLSKPKTESTPTSVTPTPTPKPTPKPTPYAGSGMGAMERADREFEEQGFKRGGSVKKMRKKIAVKRKK